MKRKLITTKQALDLLKVSRRTLFRYEKQGLIECKRINRRVIRWDESQINDLVEA